MPEINLEPIFPKYGLRKNPYFREALKIEGGIIPIESLVGRNKEKEQLSQLIQKGGGQCCLVVGEAGVGKTSLVNFIRAEAKQKFSYFTPFSEIGIEEGWKVTDVIINTLQAIYIEIKKKKINLNNKDLINSLEEIFEISLMLHDTEFKNNAWGVINTQTLTTLFRDLTDEIVSCGYKAIIIQYNNLDNFNDSLELLKLLNNLRDFFQNSNVIFFFLGDSFLPKIISYKTRLRQIFHIPETKLDSFSYEEIKQIIDIRMEQLRLSPSIEVIPPHSESSLKLLYNLYEGNIRDILNSLSNSLDLRNVRTLSSLKTKEILKEKAEEKFLKELSPTEQEVFNEILNSFPINNSDLSEKTGKKRQHISKYLKKFREIGAIKFESKEGTKEYYRPTPEALWLKLEITDKDYLEDEQERKRKMDFLQKRLSTTQTKINFFKK